MVVGVAMLGSLTVLPALLSKLGDRVEKGRDPVPRTAPPAKRRQPLLVGAPDRGAPPSAGLRDRRGRMLLAMAVPALGLHTVAVRARRAPEEPADRETLDKIQDAFPGGADPAVVAIEADDVDAPAVHEGDRAS